MRMSASVYAVITNGQRIGDHDTRADCFDMPEYWLEIKDSSKP